MMNTFSGESCLAAIRTAHKKIAAATREMQANSELSLNTGWMSDEDYTVDLVTQFFILEQNVDVTP